MPSFKRREPAIAQRKLVQGLRPAPYPSLVPLFSTGLASLDDVLSGSGLPSSSILALCPALGLATLASDENDTTQSRLPPVASSSSQTLDVLKAAEDVALSLMSYSIAQSLVSSHETLVIGKDARGMVFERVPSRATARDYGQQVAEEKQDDDSLTIAFRYAHRPKFKTTVDEPEAALEADIPAEHLFRAPFDMSKRWKREDIEAAEGRERGKLKCIEAVSYDEIWNAIKQEAERCKRLSVEKNTSPPALRIHLPRLGSQSSTKDASATVGNRLVHLSRFLGRLRRLIKDLSLHEQAPIHCVCILTISPALLVPSTSTKMATLHISRFVDSQLLISDFTHYPHLRKAYLGYGGGVTLLKGPSVGFLLPPGESRSVLRGGTAEAGAENDVGWKKRKKGVVLETLHEDVDAGVKEKKKADDDTTKKKKQGDDIEEAALGLPRKEISSPVAAPGLSPSTRPPRVKFEGLKSLRERGLRATKQVNVQVEKTDEW
jgi:elongator complex protein 4